ncbi:protein Flattop [Sorex fumeus]|uniref:protein Flattop n=1 Tax=Sorex fumeus TaxID=62283 RepID=UPI0024ACB789|nr:protein Flattop [Sorex fumeus]
MAANYSANQYEKAYRPVQLQNWSPARPTKERVAAHEGYTQIIADNRGHLLPSVPRSQASPWGSFMGTWQMPLKVPPARVNLTGRSAAGAANLTKWIQANPDFLRACNGLYPEVVGKPPEGDTAQKQPGSPSKTSELLALQPKVTPGSQDAGSVSPDSPQSRHPSAGHTPGPATSVHSPLPTCSPPNTPCSPNPVDPKPQAARTGTAASKSPEKLACSPAGSRGASAQ